MALAAVMFAPVMLAVMAAMGVTAVMMPAVPAFVAAKAKAVAEFVADDVPARAIPAVVVPAVGLALEAVFFVPAFDVPAFDRRHAAFAGLHYGPHCAKPARGDGSAFYLAVFHVQILIRLPPVSYADIRSIRIRYRLNSPHCAKPARGDGSAFYLAVFHVQILIRLPPVSYADIRSIRIRYRLNSPHCAKPARGDGAAFYLAVFHVQILIRLPPVLKSRVFGILRLAGDRKCNKPEPGQEAKRNPHPLLR